MIDPDAQLVAKCKRGDRAALELLYRRYVDRVWRYGWFVSRSRESAAEIVQETFLRVVKSLASFEGRSSFATWLFTITRSATMEFLRRERQEQRKRGDATILRFVAADELEKAERDVATRASDLDAEDPRDAIQLAVAELPAAQRDAVVLCELTGLSIAEAATVLGWGHSRVKVTLFRARRKLRETLAARSGSPSKGNRAESPPKGKYAEET